MPKSSDKHAKYYEAIIQLRPEKQEVLDFILSEVERRDDVFISKIEKLKTGIDIYISSQNFARSLGKKLKNKFKGDVKITRTIFGMQRDTGKIIYRGTVLFRLK
ncbi:hypothetical protein J4468_02140 [Candidatus Woesearchaeota archaeon]|nr:hypothetical protein [Candidatus Woesearchaeota archaeon]